MFKVRVKVWAGRAVKATRINSETEGGREKEREREIERN